MLLLGIDIGTSSIKVAVTDASMQKCLATAQYPESEAAIISLQTGWAEQSPDTWWEHLQLAILKLHATRAYDPADITAIGIAYQMHGLVMVDKQHKVLRNSIIWCDSRAVVTGEQAFDEIGHEKSLLHLLNSPGNFTAAKLAWVKQHEPAVYENTYKIMLPGDFICMKLTDSITTTVSALSEGMFWDFRNQKLSDDIMRYWDFNPEIIPEVKNLFAEHGRISTGAAKKLNLTPGIPVSYKAGDQLNNALSLNVLEPGEVAATAGTSGVIYGITDQFSYDEQSRVNSFAHVNHTAENTRIGVLLCINGTGILNSWVKNISGNSHDYAQINNAAASVIPGAEGLSILPFGNGAERILNNKNIGAHILDIDLNKHSAAHIYRAAQEGVAFAFRYGLDIMRQTGIRPDLIRAGRANMFLSNVFTDSFVNNLNVPVELYNTHGSVGAAAGAGIGVGIYHNAKEAFSNMHPVKRVEPDGNRNYEAAYEKWLEHLNNITTTPK